MDWWFFNLPFLLRLIICTIIVFKQLKYTQNKDLGLNKENVVVIANTKRLGNNEESFQAGTYETAWCNGCIYLQQHSYQSKFRRWL